MGGTRGLGRTLWQYRYVLVETVRSRYWILGSRIVWVVSVWCIGVYRMARLVIWTIGNLVVRPSARLVVSTMVGNVLSRVSEGLSWIRRFWVRSRVRYRGCLCERFFSFQWHKNWGIFMTRASTEGFKGKGSFNFDDGSGSWECVLNLSLSVWGPDKYRV